MQPIFHSSLSLEWDKILYDFITSASPDKVLADYSLSWSKLAEQYYYTLNYSWPAWFVSDLPWKNGYPGYPGYPGENFGNWGDFWWVQKKWKKNWKKN